MSTPVNQIAISYQEKMYGYRKHAWYSCNLQESWTFGVGMPDLCTASLAMLFCVETDVNSLLLEWWRWNVCLQ